MSGWRVASPGADRRLAEAGRISVATLFLAGTGFAVSSWAAPQPAPTAAEVARGIERTLAAQRPKWKPAQRTQFATEVAAHLVVSFPPHRLARQTNQFLEAFAEAAGWTNEELLTPTMLPYCVAQTNGRIDAWARRDDMTPEAQESILEQVRQLLEWGGTEIRRHKLHLAAEQVRHDLTAMLAEVERDLRNPLSEAYKRLLTKEQEKQARDAFTARLSRRDPLAGRRDISEAAWLFRQLAYAIASQTHPSSPRAVRELGDRQAVELEEYLEREMKRGRAESASAALSRVIEGAEPLEWLGWWSGALLRALQGGDPWALTMW